MSRVPIFTEAVSTPTITVTVNDATMGSASYTMDGNTAVLTATANEGYSFLTWSDGNTENPRTVTITSDTAFMAIFTEAVSTPTITLTVNDETMGSATYTLDGNTAVLTATPNEGYSFLTWSDGNTENPRTVTIGNSVTSIGDRAFYECINLSSLISLATVPPEIGGIEAFPYPNFCTVTVPCGSLAAYTTSTCRWNIFFPQRITESSSFELSVSVNEEAYGSVEVETQSCNVKTLTAIANEGYEFTAWNDGNTENPRTITITSDTAFMAIFTEAVSTPTITLTVNNEAMGSATYTLDGNTAVLTATANEGYSFLTWSDGNTENPRTVTITSDTTFMAIFTASGSSSLQDVDTKEFSLYPNPAKGFVVLEFETLQGNTPLQIFDMNGRTLRSFDLKAGREVLKIDLGDLPKGVYAIKFGNAIRKLVVE